MIEYSRPPSARSQIISLLSVLFSGFLAALAIVGALLYVYGPTGQYKATNILIGPQMVQNLSFTDTDYGRGKEGKFVFDAISFRFFDERSDQWTTARLSQEEYAAIYALLADDISVDANNADVSSFTRGTPSSLQINVKQLLGANGGGVVKSIQTLTLVPHRDYYRISLRSTGAGEDYAYFYHPGVYDSVISLVQENLK